MEKKIKTSLFSLDLIKKKELCTGISFLKPKCCIFFLCLQLSESLIYLICSRSKRLFKNTWHKYVAQVWVVSGWIPESVFALIGNSISYLEWHQVTPVNVICKSLDMLVVPTAPAPGEICSWGDLAILK